MPLIRTACALTATLALTACLAACGGSETSSETSSDPAAAQSAQDNAQDTARTKLLQCVRDQGVDIPDPSSGQRPQLDAQTQKQLNDAMQGPCAKYREASGVTGSPRDNPDFKDAVAKFSQCMRDNGVEVGDTSQGLKLDQSDPKVKTAMTACQGDLPNGGRGPAGGAGGGGS